MRPRHRVYISGPMTDKETGRVNQTHIEAFHESERLLRSVGYERIVNPARVWACRWHWLYRIVGYKATLLYDLAMLLRCDRIFKIPGWKDSRGANIESCVAWHFKIFSIGGKKRAAIEKELASYMEGFANG